MDKLNKQAQPTSLSNNLNKCLGNKLEGTNKQAKIQLNLTSQRTNKQGIKLNEKAQQTSLANKLDKQDQGTGLTNKPSLMNKLNEQAKQGLNKQA